MNDAEQMMFFYDFLEYACERVDQNHVTFNGQLFRLVWHDQEAKGWIVRQVEATDEAPSDYDLDRPMLRFDVFTTVSKLEDIVRRQNKQE